MAGLRGWLAGLALLMAGACAIAQDAPAAQAAPRSPPQSQDAITDLGALVVTGVQPGPGLWRVSRGDHVLWILGTLSPLPRGIDWDTNAVEKAISQSQEVLLAPKVELDSDTGFFGKLALLPTALKARRNPDGRTLEQVVGAREHARWLALKARYIGGDRGIEQWRPVFAALELYDKAIRKSGMRHDGIVAPAVKRMARRYRVALTEPEVVVRIERPKQALREFAATALDDRACFTRTLDRIEGDLGTMVVRANAWAIGDLDTLREQPYANQFTACSAAFTGAALARKHGIANLPQQIRAKWMAVAEGALSRNRSSFALLPIAELLKPDGYLAALQAKGYAVEAP